MKSQQNIISAQNDQLKVQLDLEAAKVYLLSTFFKNIKCSCGVL